MRNRKRVLANLTRQAALGIAIWNIPSQVLALAPPTSKYPVLRPSSSSPRLQRIDQGNVNNSNESEVTVPTVPVFPSIFPVADEEFTENVPAVEKWMPRTSSPNSSKNAPSASSNNDSQLNSLASSPPVAKPRAVNSVRSGELNWADPGVSSSSKGDVARPTPSSAKPVEKGIPKGTETPQVSRTPQRSPSAEFSNSDPQPPSLKPVPILRGDAKQEVGKGEGKGLQASPLRDKLDARAPAEAEIVEPSVLDEDPPLLARPNREQPLGNSTSRNLSARRGRDRGDDPRGERSEPTEISVEEKPHDVEIFIESRDRSISPGPKLSAPTKKSARSGRPEQEQPLVIRPEVQRLKQPLAECLRHYYRHPEDMAKRSPWGTFHSILPYGLDGKVISGKRTYNGIAWLCGNNPCRGQKLLSIDRNGQLKAIEGVGLQGHQAQFLAILGQLGVPADYPIYVSGKRFTVADLIRSEQLACKEGSELTFTLIGLSSFLPTDSTWTADDGQTWNFERLIREELKQPIVGAACGGTHRLMGFSYSLQQRRLEGLPIEGQWVRSQQYVEDMWAYAWDMQNPDGSFSTEWLAGRADNRDLDRKVQTSGHILEWLVFTSPKERLQDERSLRAVKFLLTTLTQDLKRSFEVGPKGHALRALQLFYTRVFNEQQPWLPTNVAQRPSVKR